MKRSFVIITVIVLLLSSSIGSATAAAPQPQATRGAQVSANVIPDQYIVVFKDDVADPQGAANQMALTHGLSVAFTYRSALKGFAATIPAQKLQRVKADPRVQFVSENREVGLFEDESVGSNGGGNGNKPGPAPAPQPTQLVPNGISRIGSSALDGNGVGVAVIDTGIDLSHPDLTANIVANVSCVNRVATGNDDNGHGSHVAGTIAGVDNTIGVVGVAPAAKLLAVKVLDKRGSGSWASVICGVDWVTAHVAQYSIKVANMSLGGGGSSDNSCGNVNNDALHKAICNSTAAGVTYVVAAGNSGADASASVPAAYNDTLITVSALADSNGVAGGGGPQTSYGPDDTFASFSNFGTVVDLGAPGVSIYSTYKGGGYSTLSGTSMASPHVAGAAALYVGGNAGATWTDVLGALFGAGESLGSGHTDPSGRHPERVVQVN